MTLDQLLVKMRAVWPYFPEYGDAPVEDRMELFRRLHYVMYLSPKLKQPGVPYLEQEREFNETMHRVRRDRRNQPAIWKALKRGKKFFEGHKIGGKTPGSVYVYRWEREEVVDMYEMIEEALR